MRIVIPNEVRNLLVVEVKSGFLAPKSGARNDKLLF